MNAAGTRRQWLMAAHFQPVLGVKDAKTVADPATATVLKLHLATLSVNTHREISPPIRQSAPRRFTPSLHMFTKPAIRHRIHPLWATWKLYHVLSHSLCNGLNTWSSPSREASPSTVAFALRTMHRPPRDRVPPQLGTHP